MPFLKIGILGVGGWGENLLRNFLGLKSCQLARAVDTDMTRLRALKRKYPGVFWGSEPDALFRDASIQGVVIATPPSTHVALVRKALAAGKHVFCEKPLALDLASAQELTRLAREHGKILMVGHLLRYHPAVPKLLRYLKSGNLGEVFYLHAQRLNLGKIRRHENVLWSLGPHDVSLILYLMNEMPHAVSCVGASYVQREVEDTVFLHLKFKNDRMAHIHLSWLDPHKVRKLTVVGSKKMMVFDDLEPSKKIRIVDVGKLKPTLSYIDMIHSRAERVIEPALVMEEPLKAECEHFLKCILGNKKPATDGEEAVRVIQVLEAADRSLRNSGAFVAVAETRKEVQIPELLQA